MSTRFERARILRLLCLLRPICCKTRLWTASRCNRISQTNRTIRTGRFLWLFAKLVISHMPLCVLQRVLRKIVHQFLQLRIEKLIRVDKSQMLDLERNISFQIQGDDFHTSIRRLSFLVVLGCNALTEMPEYVVGIVIFQIMKNYGNEKVIFCVFDLKITTVAQRGNEFPRTTIVVHDFRIQVRKRFITSYACPRLIETCLLFSGQG
jgi:hypothetical protein